MGAAIFVLAAVSICVVSTPCGKCYLCLYSPLLMILSIAILFGTIVLYLASRTIKSSDFQEVTILGYELTDKMEGLWIKVSNSIVCLSLCLPLSLTRSL